MDTLFKLYAQYKVDVSPLPLAGTGPDQIQTILSIVFILIGAISVLMFTIGGFRYITAQGDPQQLSKAKQTIIYAIVGVVVSVMAVTIVTFVLGKL
jgi:uncharacterized membrane protein YidH (DUF202 family)